MPGFHDPMVAATLVGVFMNIGCAARGVDRLPASVRARRARVSGPKMPVTGVVGPRSLARVSVNIRGGCTRGAAQRRGPPDAPLRPMSQLSTRARSACRRYMFLVMTNDVIRQLTIGGVRMQQQQMPQMGFGGPVCSLAPSSNHTGLP